VSVATGELLGSVAVVTGASGRLGPVWIGALLDAGATVIGLDVEGEPCPRLAEALLRRPGARFTLTKADVTSRGSLIAALEHCQNSAGTPHILVNNAGIDGPPAAGSGSWAFGDVPDVISADILEVNANGTLRSCQVFGSAMAAAGRGSIINIGSLYGTVGPDPRLYDHIELDPPFLKPPAYGMSKAGVAALTRYLAVLWGPSGVRVNTLSPGGVRGDQDGVFTMKFESRVPLGRLAEPADLAGPLVFLAGPAGRYVTGTELLVDGGFVAL